MNKKIILITSLALLFTSCGNNSNNTNLDDQEWTITFDSKGGSNVSSIIVKNDKLASKPTNPTKKGYKFVDWYVDTYYTIAFDWNTKITSDWTLYAYWNLDSESSSTSSTDSSSSSTSTDSSSDSSYIVNKGHGPENSTLTDWYIVGKGSLWEEEWNVNGRVQLYTNPGTTDKGCILSIDLSIGDIFKVTNGTTWFGYEKVNTYSSDTNKGITNFTGENDGNGGQNFKCIVAGTYDMYINNEGTFWIQYSN
jgi:hypothetical protein